MSDEQYETVIALVPDAPAQSATIDRVPGVRVSSSLKPKSSVGLISELGWASGRFAPAVLLKVFAFFTLFYLVYGAKLTPAVAGLIIFIARMSDIVSSPAIGIVSDSIQTKWGRRRPVLLLGGLLSSVSCVLLFNVPAHLNGTPKFFYLVGVMVLFELAYGLINIPHLAMAVEIAPRSAERRRMLTFGMALTTVGFLAGGIFPAIVQKFGQDSGGYGVAGWALAICVLISVLICVATTGQAKFVAARQGAFRLKDAAALCRNGPFIVYLAGEVFTALMVAGQASMLVFVIQGVMKYPLSILALTTTVGIVAQFATLPLWAILSRKFGNRRAMLLALMIGLSYSVTWIFASRGEPLWAFLSRYVLFGATVSGCSLIQLAIKSDIAEYGNLTSGKHSEGLYTAVFSFAEKTAGAFGILVSGVVLGLGGFNRKLPSMADQAPQAVRALFIGVGIMPTLGYVVMFLLFLRFYHLDDRRLAAAGASAGSDRMNS